MPHLLSLKLLFFCLFVWHHLYSLLFFILQKVELVDVLPTLAHLGGIVETAIRGPPLSGASLVPLLGPLGSNKNKRRRPRALKAKARMARARGEGWGSRKAEVDNDDDENKEDDEKENDGEEEEEDIRTEHRAASVTQFVRCPVTITKNKSKQQRASSSDFRSGTTSAIHNACVRTVRGWQWYETHDLVVMGYSLRTKRWRYTAWMLW